jgi:hypothetical protein
MKINTPIFLNSADRSRRINPYRMFVGSMIPNWLQCRGEISQGAKLAYARLAQHAGQNGECFPKQTTLAAELGVSERTANEYIRELVNARLIETERPGLGRPNRYYFLAHPWIYEGQPSFAQMRKKASVADRQDSSVQNRQEISVPIIKENQEKVESERKESPPLSPCQGEPDRILSIWNGFSELTPAQTMTSNRARKIRKRLSDLYWRKHWREGIQRLAKSDYAKGGGQNGWRASLDWFLNADSLTKILEGTYDNRPQPERKLFPSDLKAQIKALDEVIADHPANPVNNENSYDATKEQQKELKQIRLGRAALVRQLAGVGEQPLPPAPVP